MERYYKKWFYLLVLPAVLLFVFVIGLPFVIGTIYSFTSWRGTYFAGGTLSESFVGLENYIQAFSDEQFIHSMIYTTAYTLVAVVAINIVALSFALMLGRIKRGVGLYRTVFFLPNMLGGLAMGFIWQFIFQIVFSSILFGGENPLISIPFLTNMLQDHYKALFALVILVT